MVGHSLFDAASALSVIARVELKLTFLRETANGCTVRSQGTQLQRLGGERASRVPARY